MSPKRHLWGSKLPINDATEQAVGPTKSLSTRRQSPQAPATVARSSGYRTLAKLLAAGTITAITAAIVYYYAPELLWDNAQAVSERVQSLVGEIKDIPFDPAAFTETWEADNDLQHRLFPTSSMPTCALDAPEGAWRWGATCALPDGAV